MENYLGRLVADGEQSSLLDAATALEVLAAHHFDLEDGEGPMTATAALGGLAAGPLVRTINFHNTARAQSVEVERQLLGAGERYRSVDEDGLDGLLSGKVWQVRKPPLIPVLYEGYREQLRRRVAAPRAGRAARMVLHPNLVYRHARVRTVCLRQGTPHRSHGRRLRRRPLRDDVGRTARCCRPRAHRRLPHGHALRDRGCKNSRGRPAGAHRLASATRRRIGDVRFGPLLALRRALRRERERRCSSARGRLPGGVQQREDPTPPGRSTAV